MTVIAKLQYLRIAPRKVRLISDLIRGKRVETAQTILNFTAKKPAEVLSKLLKQAIANAKNNFHLDESNLYISKIIVDEGPKLKRFRPRARGTAYEIQKKTSHIILILDEIEKKLPKGKPSVSYGASKKVRRVRKERLQPTRPSTEEKPKAAKIEKFKKVEKSLQPKPKPEKEVLKPKITRGLKRIFRRQTF